MNTVIEKLFILRCSTQKMKVLRERSGKFMNDTHLALPSQTFSRSNLSSDRYWEYWRRVA